MVTHLINFGHSLKDVINSCSFEGISFLCQVRKTRPYLNVAETLHHVRAAYKSALNTWISSQISVITNTIRPGNGCLTLNPLSMKDLLTSSQEESLILHAFGAPVPN